MKCTEQVRMCAFCLEETMEGDYNDGEMMDFIPELREASSSLYENAL